MCVGAGPGAQEEGLTGRLRGAEVAPHAMRLEAPTTQNKKKMQTLQIACRLPRQREGMRMFQTSGLWLGSPKESFPWGPPSGAPLHPSVLVPHSSLNGLSVSISNQTQDASYLLPSMAANDAQSEQRAPSRYPRLCFHLGDGQIFGTSTWGNCMFSAWQTSHKKCSGYSVDAIKAVQTKPGMPLSLDFCES